jgi:cbb3-type cytochrome oxidase subunit 3
VGPIYAIGVIAFALFLVSWVWNRRPERDD